MTRPARGVLSWPVVACVLAALMLGACARPGGTVPVAPAAPAPPAAPAKVHPSWAGCASTGAFADGVGAGVRSGSGPAGRGSVPSGFVATSALLCDHGERRLSNGDTVQVELERRADDIEALLSYLARPSEISTDPDLACAAMAWLPPWLFLRDAEGRWLAPAVPQDACGFPLDQFEDPGPAFAQLRYLDQVVGRGRVLESAAAKASGCGMSWKDMVAVQASEAPHQPMPTADPFDGSQIRVCVYRVPESEGTSFSPSGEFVRGAVLDRGQRRTLLSGLARARAEVTDCKDGAGHFAVLQSVTGDPFLYVELDGCRRLLDPGAGVGTARLAAPDNDLIRFIDRVAR